MFCVLYREEAQETVTVALAKPFTKADVGSKVTLKLSFTGVLNDKLAGMLILFLFEWFRSAGSWVGAGSI
jgi:hypothetical protein